jgi:hypothetical protein
MGQKKSAVIIKQMLLILDLRREKFTPKESKTNNENLSGRFYIIHRLVTKASYVNEICQLEKEKVSVLIKRPQDNVLSLLFNSLPLIISDAYLMLCVRPSHCD